MNQIGIIGYILLTIGAVGEYGHNKNVSELLYLAYILGYSLLFLEKVNKKSNMKYSYGHIILAGLYLLNLLWIPFIQHNQLLTLGLIIMHVLLIKHHTKYYKYAYILAIILYAYIGINIFNDSHKSVIEILKMFGCLLIFFYYISHIFEKNKKLH
jgi:hypothetical protein